MTQEIEPSEYVSTSISIYPEHLQYVRAESKACDMKPSQYFRWLINEARRLSLSPRVRFDEKYIETKNQPEPTAN